MASVTAWESNPGSPLREYLSSLDALPEVGVDKVSIAQ